MEEKKLVQAAREGSEEAFAALVEKYRLKMFHLAFSITRDTDMADDLAQEVFIKAFFALPKFKSRSGFGTWLYKIAVNTGMDHLRKERTRRRVVLQAETTEPVFQDDGIERREIEEEKEKKRKLLYTALRSLPEKHQIILMLRDIQGFPYQEIADILEISPGTVDSRLHRARERLRKRLIFLAAHKGEDHDV